jgi:hypothetical protein
MPRTKTPSSIKDERLYEDLRKQGDSKEMAARISTPLRPKVGRPWARGAGVRAHTRTGLCPTCVVEPKSLGCVAIRASPSGS